MKIEVKITSGAITSSAKLQVKGAGAVISFDGVVRLRENNKEIIALDYEIYEPMTSNELERLAKEISSKYGLLALRIEHSQGQVDVGQCSMRVQVASKHRKEAIKAVDEFINKLKKQVPIWKVPVWK